VGVFNPTNYAYTKPVFKTFTLSVYPGYILVTMKNGEKAIYDLSSKTIFLPGYKNVNISMIN